MVQKDFDVFQMVHVRLRHRKVAAFDVAVIRCQVQRRPATLIGDIHVRAVFNQIRCEFVVPVVGRRQQWSPSVLRDLIHIGSLLKQELC